MAKSKKYLIQTLKVKSILKRKFNPNIKSKKYFKQQLKRLYKKKV